MHPALLDAAFQAMMLAPAWGGPRARRGGPAAVRMTGVSLLAPGARDLRVRISPIGPDTVTITATDETGDPVLVIERLVSRQVPVERLRAGRRPGRPVAVRPGAGSRRRPGPPAGSANDWALLGADPAGLRLARRGSVRSGLRAVGGLVPAADPPRCRCRAGSAGRGPAVPARRRAARRLGHRRGPAGLGPRRPPPESYATSRRGSPTTAPGTPGWSWSPAARSRPGRRRCPDLTAAAVWGLLRSAPDREPGPVRPGRPRRPRRRSPRWSQALAGDEPQIAVRRGAP